MNDWMDDAWLDFVDAISPHSLDVDGLKLLKAAWLHGARSAIDKAAEIASASSEDDSNG